MALKYLISKTTGKYLKSKTGQLLGKETETYTKFPRSIFGDGPEGSGSYILSFENGFKLAVEVEVNSAEIAFKFSSDKDLHTIMDYDTHFGYNTIYCVYDPYANSDTTNGRIFEFYDFDYYTHSGYDEVAGDPVAEAEYIYEHGDCLVELQIDGLE